MSSGRQWLDLVAFARALVFLEILSRVVGPPDHGPYLLPLTGAELPPRLDATGYLRGLTVVGSPISTSLPIPDEADELAAPDPDDCPWSLLEQVQCSCGRIAIPEPDEQYGTLWRCECGLTYADEN